MTEYAVMKDSILEKIVYVFLCLSIFFTYIADIINSVYRMVSNFLISWAY